MCGRFPLTADIAFLAERLHFDPTGLLFTPSYNIAPGQQILTVLNDGTHSRTGYLRWGLVPSWAKDPSSGHPYDQCACRNRGREAELSAG